MIKTIDVKQEVILGYVERAQKAERQRLEAETHRRPKDAELYGKLAMYCWMQAEHAELSDEDVKDGHFARHALDRRFLGAVTGDTEAMMQGEWSEFHAFLVTASLDILTARQCAFALMRHVAGFSPQEIAEHFDMRDAKTGALKVAAVNESLARIRSRWDAMLSGEGVKESDAPVDLTTYRNASQRLTERVLESVGSGTYRTGEIAALVGANGSLVSNVLHRLAKQGRLAFMRVGVAQKRRLWMLPETYLRLGEGSEANVTTSASGE